MSTSSKKWIWKSNDNETCEVEEAAASQSVTIKHMIEDFTDEDTMTLPNINGNILAKVTEYCKKHVETPSDVDANAKIELKKFDTEFVNVEWSVLFDLILAANYLNIPGLLDLVAQAIAESIKDLQPEEVRKIFNLENDFTKEEEDALRNENKWAFEV